MRSRKPYPALCMPKDWPAQFSLRDGWYRANTACRRWRKAARRALTQDEVTCQDCIDALAEDTVRRLAPGYRTVMPTVTGQSTDFALPPLPRPQGWPGGDT